MEGRFQPGDHIQVRQWLGAFPYYHHGIYVSDDRVIQFGPGIAGKANAKIEAVMLSNFERHAPAEVVRHGRAFALSGYLFEADEPWKIVARAEFLLELQPRLPYNLIGHNCEHIANMCVSGGYTESHQVRTLFGVKAYATLPFFAWYLHLSRYGRVMPKALVWGLVLGAIAGPIAIQTYNKHIKQFWDEIKGAWLEHERALSEAPPPPDGTEG